MACPVQVSGGNQARNDQARNDGSCDAMLSDDVSAGVSLSPMPTYPVAARSPALRFRPRVAGLPCITFGKSLGLVGNADAAMILHNIRGVLPRHAGEINPARISGKGGATG